MRLFGTDGIRDIANQGNLTPLMLARIGAAFGRILATRHEEKKPIRVLMGEDGRASGVMIRHALSAGLLGEGIDVVHGGLMTTPTLALITAIRDFSAGVMISASHNPAHHNGIKFFGGEGSKLPDEEERAIEEMVAITLGDEAAGNSHVPPGRASRELGITETYSRYLTAEVVPDLFLGSLKVLLDCANGGGSELAPKVLQELGAELVVVHNQPDGTNINNKCGAVHPELLAARVKGEKADLGISLDGDGDRCMLVDERGRVVDGDRILMILARHLHGKEELRNNLVICTVMSNLGLREALSRLDARVEMTPVGDRSVVRRMLETKAVLGGEQSGHIILNQNDRFIGDGLLTALKVMEVMKEEDAPLSELAADFKSYPQILLDLEVKEKIPFAEIPGVNEIVARAEEELGDRGRVLLRYSGTEMLARIMVEGPDKGRVKEIAGDVKDAIARAEG